MIDLPDETEDIRISNALLCSELNHHMAGIGPFIPHPDTPLAEHYFDRNKLLEINCKAVSLPRVLMPDINIPATTATGTIYPMGRERVISAGANILMPNITPVKAKKLFVIS